MTGSGWKRASRRQSGRYANWSRHEWRARQKTCCCWLPVTQPLKCEPATPRRTATYRSARYAFIRRPAISASSWRDVTLTGTRPPPLPIRWSSHPSGDEAFRPIWVTDFPMFEFDNESQRWLPAHHPFTSPHEEDMERLVSDPASVRARYYDLAMNGLELGSGSIRIHRQDVQQEIFRALGMSEDEARSRFGFFLEALTYGTPPHGG